MKDNPNLKLPLSSQMIISPDAVREEDASEASSGGRYDDEPDAAEYGIIFSEFPVRTKSSSQ